MKKQKLTEELFNLKMFDILLAFQIFKKFGDVDIISKNPKDLTEEQQKDLKILVKEISQFNNQLNKQNEKSVQLGQDDQTTA